ncbi:MAG: hypothetical protein Q9186_006323 [Xanthomendoza sp. 1 TL-2023]
MGGTDERIVLNTLQTACQSQPPLTGYLPISAVQVFLLAPPQSPSPTTTNATSTPPPESSDSGGLSWNAKVAIAISVPVAALLIFSLLCLLIYVHRKSRRRRRSKKHLTKSSSHRTQRSHRPTNHFPPQKLHHRKTLSDETTKFEKPQWTFNRPLTYPAPSVYSTSKDHNNYNRVPYPAPLRPRATPSPNLTSPNHTESATAAQSPRSRLPSHLTSLSRPQTANSLSPPPLNIGQHPAHRPALSPHTASSPLTIPPNTTRPPPPPRGLVSWEQRGIQHARTKSMRNSLRRSGESSQILGVGMVGEGKATERVKVAMQVPRDANISEWKEETRTPTPVTISEEVGEERDVVGVGVGVGGGVLRGGSVRRREEEREREMDWRRRTGST